GTKPEAGSLREGAVVNADARLFVGQVHERHIGSARLCVVKDRVPGAEGPARTILTRQSDWNPFQKKRSKRERLGVMHFVLAAFFEDFALMIEHDAFDLRLNFEALRNTGEPIDDGLESFLTDGRRLGGACVFGLKNRRRFPELRFLASLSFFDGLRSE